MITLIISCIGKIYVQLIGHKRFECLVVDKLLGIIKDTLVNGEGVLVSGFGKFYVKDKRRRRGRNPATGEDLMLGSRRVVRFKCSGVLRDKINGNG